MTMFDRLNHPNVPTIRPPGEQRAVWFLGALIRVRAGASATGGSWRSSSTQDRALTWRLPTTKSASGDAPGSAA
jgi:hypothetical protein